MDRELTQEYVANAEMALENGRHAEALEWLRMAISEDPTDVYALSRAGAVCVSQELFDEALDYFQRALAVDPSSGDSNFNLGNAYFFRKDFNRAFAYYVEAENLGCSLDVMIQLNYAVHHSRRSGLCQNLHAEDGGFGPLRYHLPHPGLHFRKAEAGDALPEFHGSPEIRLPACFRGARCVPALRGVLQPSHGRTGL